MMLSKFEQFLDNFNTTATQVDGSNRSLKTIKEESKVASESRT